MKGGLYGCCLLVVILAGCGGQECEQVEVVSQFARVEDRQGQEKVVPAEELYMADPAQPQYETVWVVDRQTNRRLFVPLDQLESRTPADARYILATVSAEGAGNAADQRQAAER